MGHAYYAVTSRAGLTKKWSFTCKGGLSKGVLASLLYIHMQAHTHAFMHIHTLCIYIPAACRYNQFKAGLAIIMTIQLLKILCSLKQSFEEEISK